MGSEPARWRLEIYGGLQAEVPDHWGYGSTYWPTGARRVSGPFVGRLGGIPLNFVTPVPPEQRDAYLWFDTVFNEPGMRTCDAGWVEETRVVAGMRVTVFTDDDELRERLLSAVRPVVDDTDCPADHRITESNEARPEPGQSGLEKIGQVRSVTVCRYALGEVAERLVSPVLSMSRITGPNAARLVRAIAAAPEGSGPNTPGNCGPDHAYGDEAIVLIVRDSGGTREVFVRYSGCVGHGFDDGRVRRWLTAETLEPILAGPHWPLHGLQVAVADLAWPGRKTG